MRKRGAIVILRPHQCSHLAEASAKRPDVDPGPGTGALPAPLEEDRKLIGHGTAASTEQAVGPQPDDEFKIINKRPSIKPQTQNTHVHV